ncbi:hypothetical protein Sta7437_0727 [Stanieria cyanosphaera PCC 7437]|uniref:S-layer domain-containing protein n=1 Tax=Stanieria cyanosphaera (strain ATCC 29371 / PCC 7437) TaxID=111780 RepID=K9XQI9_STAC7|nr:hypothetical protein [Stanieria cyanosphaera]AFZ34321.1 hypothetical protein Sta7437_0727 [Stanieria cyanosphaera PCC 7437]
MFASRYFKPATSLLMSLTIGMVAITPLVSLAPASAQLFPSQNRPNRNNYPNPNLPSQLIIPAGAEIPVFYEDAEKILVTKEETAPLTLKVAANLRNRDRVTLIPYGTEIVGQIEPTNGGSRFVAQELVFSDGTRKSIDATSQTITRTETVRRGASAGGILKGAAIGAAAATVVSGVTGDRAIATEEVLGGGAIGAAAGWLLGRKQVELISIDPNSDLNLTLQSDLALR